MIIDPHFLPYFIALGGFLLGGVLVLIFRIVLEKKRIFLYAEQQKQLMGENEQLEKNVREAELSLVQLRTSIEGMEVQQQQKQQRVTDLELNLAKEVDLRYRSEREAKVIEAQLNERDASFKKQIEQFEQQKSELKKEFELLANRIFEEKGKSFDHHSKHQIDSVLKPFREQIEGFQKRVNEVHTQSVQGNSQLEAQIKNVLDVGLKMSDEAQTLAHALKGDKKAQGNWSEVQAELLLEMSGLSEGREYQREANFKTEDGRDQRPDFIINLPNDKHIIIDSKISLNAYVQSVSAETDEERAVYMRSHVDAIRLHVKSLSDKNYTKLKGINSPEYVFMFIGNEPAYLSAAEFEPNLFQEAYRKGIAIVTPNTLLSSLRIVAHLWSIDKQNSNTRQLAEQASKVYDKLRVFADKMQKLGNQITTVQKTYEESWSTLKDGRGSLAKQVDKFVDMGVSVKEKLPGSITEENDLLEPE